MTVYKQYLKDLFHTESMYESRGTFYAALHIINKVEEDFRDKLDLVVVSTSRERDGSPRVNLGYREYSGAGISFRVYVCEHEIRVVRVWTEKKEEILLLVYNGGMKTVDKFILKDEELTRKFEKALHEARDILSEYIKTKVTIEYFRKKNCFFDEFSDMPSSLL